jgi:hypothetical protein
VSAEQIPEAEVAVKHEQEVAAEAAVIRGYATTLTPELYLKLWPLLRKPIPRWFIKSVGVVKGKPYASTGVSSAQVQVERMDNVLTPLWWRDTATYEKEGTLARVVVEVGNLGELPLVCRGSYGGVDRGSTAGNVYKGSYTNAAKVAFARVGPGHEIYLDAVDLDPDVHEQAAAEQVRSHPAQAGTPRLLTPEECAKVVKATQDAGLDDDELMLLLGSVGVDSTDDLTTAHAFEIRGILDRRQGS